MRVSVVATVYNEEKSIAALIDSLLNQTKEPDEIVIVDGGSSDSTKPTIKSLQNKTNKIVFIEHPGSIAEGRNVAINTAKNEIIAQIDGGCIAHADWLEKITEPLEKDTVGLVAGFYNMTGKTPFQKAIAAYHGIHPRRFDPRSFMPSGRSMAFRKEVWELVGGYSESLERAGEDTFFNYEVLKAGVRVVRVKDALVDWELPMTYMESLKKFYRYAKGDAQAGIWWHPAQRMATHNIKILLVFLRYLAGFLLLALSPIFPVFLPVLAVLFIFYTYFAIWKNRDVIDDFWANVWIPVIQISSDVTVILGFISGLLPRRKSR